MDNNVERKFGETVCERRNTGCRGMLLDGTVEGYTAMNNYGGNLAPRSATATKRLMAL
jgi:hypothetical protein